MKKFQGDYDIRSKKLITRVIVLLTFCIIVVITGILYIYIIKSKEVPIIDGKISRTYDEVINSLEYEPRDITKQKYRSIIPEMVQNDIDMMMNSGEDLSIVYGQSNAQIVIEKNEEKYCVKISQSQNDEYIELYDVSLYRNTSEILIYGRYSENDRLLYKYSISSDSNRRSEYSIHYDMDLWGSNIKDSSECDDIRPFNQNGTLIRIGNEFYLYRLGKKLKSYVFPGKEIKEMTFEYIVDTDNNLYYMYYSTDLSDPWIKFVMISDKINAVTDKKVTLMEENEENPLEFPIFIKNRKKYVAVMDAKTERAYGQSYGKHSDGEEANFDFSIIELNVETSNIILKKDYRGWFISFDFEGFDWVLQYNFVSGSKTVFYQERLNGLDQHISEKIPKEKLDAFDGLNLTIDQIEDVKKELKELYSQYE